MIDTLCGTLCDVCVMVDGCCGGLLRWEEEEEQAACVWVGGWGRYGWGEGWGEG